MSVSEEYFTLLNSWSRNFLSGLLTLPIHSIFPVSHPTCLYNDAFHVTAAEGSSSEEDLLMWEYKTSLIGSNQSHKYSLLKEAVFV